MHNYSKIAEAALQSAPPAQICTLRQSFSTRDCAGRSRTTARTVEVRTLWNTAAELTRAQDAAGPLSRRVVALRLAKDLGLLERLREGAFRPPAPRVGPGIHGGISGH